MAISGKYYMMIFTFQGKCYCYFRFQDLMEKESDFYGVGLKSGKYLCLPLLVIQQFALQQMSKDSPS